MIYHKKLVRDKIPQIIHSKGKICVSRRLDEEEYNLELRSKLKEEVKEYLDDPCKEELADILEVIDALASTHALTLSEVLRFKEEKKEYRGGFSDRIFLDYVTEVEQGSDGNA